MGRTLQHASWYLRSFVFAVRQESALKPRTTHNRARWHNRAKPWISAIREKFLPESVDYATEQAKLTVRLMK
jgi:hypothetical protein